jgi:APA family basic amino acid/polyamine antiporter
MIGSGIFKKIAPMAASGLSEYHIIGAWVVAGIVTMLGAFTVSGLAGLTTESGGEYEYLRIIFGNFPAFLFGWASFTIIGSASIAALAFIFTQSVQVFFPIPEPLYDLRDLSVGGTIYPFSNSGIKFFSVAVIMALTWLNIRGTKKGALLNNGITYAKIAGILMLILLGLSYTGGSHPLQPAASTAANNAGYGWLSIFFAAMLSAFWAYDGWLNVSFISGEIKNPARNVPIAIISGVCLVTVIYILVNLAYMKVLPLEKLATLGENDIAASAMMQSVWGRKGTVLISLLIMLSTFGTLNGLIITYARMYYKMAQDGFFFKKAAYAHPRFRTPYVALVYSMVISCLLVFSGTFDTLTDMIIFAGFLFYAMLAIGLIRLKQKGLIKKGLIGYPVVPALFILFSIGLLVNTCITQPGQTIMGLLLMLSGVPFYLYFRWRNKRAG